jgi:cytochrome c
MAHTDFLLKMMGSVAALGLLAACGGGGQEASAPAPEATAEVAPEADMTAEAEVVEEAAPAEAEVTPVAATENFADFTGTAAAGKAVFVQCQACHVQQEGVNRVGPSLHNIVGRQSGSVEGFRYSQANQGSNVVWTEENLFTYLKNPRAFMPGTTMAFAGIPDPQKRADLIAFLKVNGEI